MQIMCYEDHLRIAWRTENKSSFQNAAHAAHHRHRQRRIVQYLQTRIELEGSKTLDLFGGTGSITYELASRGAVDLTVVEKDAAMFAFIKKNIAELKIENCKVIRMDVFNFLAAENSEYDFIFAGPPYALNTIDELPKINRFKKNDCTRRPFRARAYATQ
jgi:16S rRNA G966 N2-methylase RsmD